MDKTEQNKILKARSIGPTVLEWLMAADYSSLADFAAETPENIAFRVEIATGIRPNRNALKAYENLIALAQDLTGDDVK